MTITMTGFPVFALFVVGLLRTTMGWSSPRFVGPRTPGHRPRTTAPLRLSGGRSRKAVGESLDVNDGRLPVSTEGLPPLHEDPLVPLVHAIVRAADGRKAEDIRALRVSRVTATTSFLVLLSGNSRPQNQAIAAAVRDAVAQKTIRGNGVPEGTAESGWILLDYGDIMVHVMTPKSRLFYDIEGKWTGSPEVEELDLTELLVPNHVRTDEPSPTLGGGMANLDEEEDPFWS